MDKSKGLLLGLVISLGCAIVGASLVFLLLVWKLGLHFTASYFVHHPWQVLIAMAPGALIAGGMTYLRSTGWTGLFGFLGKRSS